MGGGAEAGKTDEVKTAEPRSADRRGGCPHIDLCDKISRYAERAVKAKVPANSVDEYLARVPEPARGTLQHIRAVIRSVVPAEATEVISYGIPMFKYNGMLVGYAAFKNHCSLFPTGSRVLDQFEKELGGYRTSKGTIQFPPDRALPDALVKKIVKARVKENEEWD